MNEEAEAQRVWRAYSPSLRLSLKDACYSSSTARLDIPAQTSCSMREGQGENEGVKFCSLERRGVSGVWKGAASLRPLQLPSQGKIDPQHWVLGAIWLCLNLSISEQISTGAPRPSSEHHKSLAGLRSSIPASV